MESNYPDLNGGDTSYQSQSVDVAPWSSPLMKLQRFKGSSSTDLISCSASHNSQNDAMLSSESDLHDFDDDAEDEDFDYNEDGEDNDFALDTQLADDVFNEALAVQFEDQDLPPGVEATVSFPDYSEERPSDLVSRIGVTDDISIKLESFKKFDTVRDFSDHHFKNHEVKKASKDWVKRIQNEWKILEKDLPDSIYARVCEDRMDLLRAVIVGPAGTPYHDGLFFFDLQFRADYPHAPPKVYYHSGGLRINPNLYGCGKVCLSLLNTWTGYGCEKWNTSKSTMLQVLVSIQALVLNEKPYFNEPGRDLLSTTTAGQKSSLAYNQKVFLLSCSTMLYSLRRPPKHFEGFTASHFRKHGHTILMACKGYMNGAEIGSVVQEVKQVASNECPEQFNKFKSKLEQLFEQLLKEFAAKGADCHQFEQPLKARKSLNSSMLQWWPKTFSFGKKAFGFGNRAPSH